MTKLLVVGDVHVSDRPPSIRTETYTEDILDKLRFIVAEAAKRKVNALVFAGDVFHIKTPTRTSHALVQKVGDILREAGIPVKIVPGNHDLSNDRLDSLPKQPLGTLGKMEGIELLIGPDPELPLFGLPYLSDWTTELPRWMSKYREWCGEKKIEDFDFWPLMVTHAPIFPVGEDPPYDYIPADEWAMLMQNGDCYYGHIHDPHGYYAPEASVPVTLCNNGAISRGSIAEATLKRAPKVTLWESSDNESRWTTIDVPHRPADAVFRLKEKEDVDERNTRVEEFLENIGTTTLDGLSLEEVNAQARTRGLKPRTVSLIEELLENV